MREHPGKLDQAAKQRQAPLALALLTLSIGMDLSACRWPGLSLQTDPTDIRFYNFTKLETARVLPVLVYRAQDGSAPAALSTHWTVHHLSGELRARRPDGASIIHFGARVLEGPKWNVINYGDSWATTFGFSEELTSSGRPVYNVRSPLEEDAEHARVPAKRVPQELAAVSLYQFDKAPIHLVVRAGVQLNKALPPELISDGVLSIRIETSLESNRYFSYDVVHAPCAEAAVKLEVPIRDLVEVSAPGKDAPSLPAMFRFWVGEPLEGVSQRLCAELKMRERPMSESRRIVVADRTESAPSRGFSGYPASFSRLVLDGSWTVPCEPGLAWSQEKKNCFADTRPTDPVEGRGPRLLPVPGGPFEVGPDQDVPNSTARRLVLQPFRIDDSLVTRGQYAACLRTGVCTKPEIPDYGYWETPEVPATGLTFHQALAYCRWAGKRLPTEEEWERAARGTDGRMYPWGSAEPSPATVCAVKYSWNQRPCPVGAHPAADAPTGAKDLVCNVAQWTSSSWCASSASSSACGGDKRVVRGGDATEAHDAGYGKEPSQTAPRVLHPCRLTRRDYGEARGIGHFLGFRCAADAPKPEGGSTNERHESNRRGAGNRKGNAVQSPKKTGESGY